LLTVTKLIAPIAPFVADEVYRSLNADRSGMLESVHLDAYPSAGDPLYQFREPELESRMRAVLDIVAAGRTLRNEKNLKVRQPLRRIIVVTANREQKTAIENGAVLIREELNVKAVEFVDKLEALTIRRAEPFFKALGPKFGKRANAVAEAIRTLSSEQISRLEAGEQVSMEVAGEPAVIVKDDVRIQAENAPGMAVGSNGAYTVALDTQLDDDLIAEGMAREFVNRIQNMRKDAGFEVLDRIRIAYQSSDALDKAVQKMSSYVRAETLAEELLRSSANGGFAQEWDVNGEKASISIQKVSPG
jgi:isoleucyl-tRNA synthetase